MSEQNFWDIEHELAFIERHPNGFKPFKKNPATIDKNGYRHVWCVVNKRGVRKYFDNSKDALELARNSKFQPCDIVQIPIYPCWEYHHTDLESLVILIEEKLREEGKIW